MGTIDMHTHLPCRSDLNDPRDQAFVERGGRR